MLIHLPLQASAVNRGNGRQSPSLRYATNGRGGLIILRQSRHMSRGNAGRIADDNGRQGGKWLETRPTWHPNWCRLCVDVSSGCTGLVDLVFALSCSDIRKSNIWKCQIYCPLCHGNSVNVLLLPWVWKLSTNATRAGVHETVNLQVGRK